MVEVVDGFRWALLGSKTPPGPVVLVSGVVTVLFLIGGAMYFRRMEAHFADVV
jgi:lipopolysaccharide transport system permease protein